MHRTSLGVVEISVTPPVRVTPDIVKAYEDAGVHRLVIARNTPTPDDAVRAVGELGELAR